MAPSCKHISNLILTPNENHTTYYDMFEAYDQDFFEKRNNSLNIRVYKKKIDENKINQFIDSFLKGEVMYAQSHFENLFMLKDSLYEDEIKYRIRQTIQNEINNHNSEFMQFGELVTNDFLFHKTLIYSHLDFKITFYNEEEDKLEKITKSYINKLYAKYRDHNIMVYINPAYIVDLKKSETVLNEKILIKKLDEKYVTRILELFKNVSIIPELGKIAKLTKDSKGRLVQLKADDEVLVLHKPNVYFKNNRQYTVITKNGESINLYSNILRTLPAHEQTQDRINSFKTARENKLRQEQKTGYPVIGRVFHIQNKYLSIETIEQLYIRIPYSLIPDSNKNFELNQFVTLFIPKWLYEKYYK